MSTPRPLPLLLAFLLLPVLSASADDKADVAEILKRTPNGPGLIIVIGVTEARADMVAALASGSKCLVHGLAVDDAALAKARKAIDAAGLMGRATVSRQPQKTLPFVSDLANMVVVADPEACRAAGIADEETLRVLAPEHGWLCAPASNGGWGSAMKPRPAEMDVWSYPQHGADGNMVSNDKLVRFPLGFRWLDGVGKNFNRWASVRFLFWQNAGPLVADDDRVYAVKKDKPVIIDGATGQVLHTLATKYAPARLLLIDGLLVAACWEARDQSKAT
jgi:hypothetical protein